MPGMLTQLCQLTCCSNLISAVGKTLLSRCPLGMQGCYACMGEGGVRLAQLCGLNIIINADDPDEVADFYQCRAFSEQLITMTKSGIGLERAHVGILTGGTLACTDRCRAARCGPQKRLPMVVPRCSMTVAVFLLCRTGHVVCQVQDREADGAPGVVQRTHQHPVPDPGVWAIDSACVLQHFLQVQQMHSAVVEPPPCRSCCMGASRHD